MVQWYIAVLHVGIQHVANGPKLKPPGPMTIAVLRLRPLKWKIHEQYVSICIICIMNSYLFILLILYQNDMRITEGQYKDLL